MVTVTCNWCNKEFEKFPGHAKRCKRHFCCRECYALWQRGRPSYERTPKHRVKMSLAVSSNTEAMKGNSAQLRRYNLQVKKGHTWEEIYGPEKAARLRKHYRETMSGKNNPNFGNHLLAGKNNPNWKGGVCREPYSFEFDEVLKEQIRQRDGYACQLCGMPQDEQITHAGVKLSVHHIDYDKTNNAASNLVSLCKSCHSKTNYNREYYMRLFTAANSEYIGKHL